MPGLACDRYHLDLAWVLLALGQLLKEQYSYVLMQSEARLRFKAAACLPRRFPAFACQRCADACPSGALMPSPTGPRLASGCTDCGQCVTRCPTEALAVPGFDSPQLAPQLSPEPPAVGVTTPAPISLDCWRVAPQLTPADGLRVPCLGGLTPAWLLELVASAAGRPVQLLDRGLCAACPAGQTDPEHSDDDAQDLHPARWCLDETARLLDGIGLRRELWPRLTAALTADEGSASSPQEAKPAERLALQRPEPLLETRLSRRAFFTGRRAEPPRSRHHEQPGRQDRMPRQGLALASVEQGSDHHQRLPDQGPADQRLPERLPKRLPEQARRLAALLRLVPAECVPARLFPALAITDACDHHSLCASACPSGALSRYHRDGEQGHRFNPSDCTACGLCVALCPEQAIELRPIAIQDGKGGMSATLTQTLTQFSTRACVSCGAEIPVADADRTGHEDRPGGDRLDESLLCPACARDQDFARSAFQTLFAARL